MTVTRRTLFGAVAASLLVAVLMPTAAVGQQPSVPQLRAGAAASNITPPLGLPIVGNFNQPVAKHVHDELYARCLVLDDGQVRLAIVVCDNLGVPRETVDEAKRLVQAATGIPPAHVLVSATHTHSAASAKPRPASGKDDATGDYAAFLARRIADGVARAVNNLEPARIGWAAADEPRPLFNRRYRMKPGTELLNPFGGADLVKMNPGVGNPDVVEPAGPTDPQVSFICVRAKANDRPIALLANYSLHYVGGVPATDVSADYFGAFADRVQQRLGADRLDPPFVGILSNGTSGDVNNVDVMGPKPTTRPAPYRRMREVADMVADAVVKAHERVEFRDHVPLRAAARDLTLKARKPTPDLVERAKRIVAGELKPKGPHVEAYARRTLELHESPDEVSVSLQALRIGDLGIAAIPFETFTETGLDIKRRSPLKPAFTISIANGYYGYLPTPEAHRAGGYETWLGTNRVEVDAEPRIVDALMRMMEELKQ